MEKPLIRGVSEAAQRTEVVIALQHELPEAFNAKQRDEIIRAVHLAQDYASLRGNGETLHRHFGDLVHHSVRRTRKRHVESTALYASLRFPVSTFDVHFLQIGKRLFIKRLQKGNERVGVQARVSPSRQSPSPTH